MTARTHPRGREALTEELDARIAAVFADDVKSDEVRRVLADVEAAAKLAEAAAEDARARALDPLVADVIVARRACSMSSRLRGGCNRLQSSPRPAPVEHLRSPADRP